MPKASKTLPPTPSEEQRTDADPPLAAVHDLQAWRVRVTGSATHGSQRRSCAARAVDPDGMVLEGADAAALGRYVWLDVGLPDGGDVRALGEVVGRRDAVELALEVKFKHLFPDARRRLYSALGR